MILAQSIADVKNGERRDTPGQSRLSTLPLCELRDALLTECAWARHGVEGVSYCRDAGPTGYGLALMIVAEGMLDVKNRNEERRDLG